MIEGTEAKKQTFLRRVLKVVFLCSNIALPNLAAAQSASLLLGTTPDEVPEKKTKAEEIGLRQDDGSIHFTLEQAITLALQRNLTLAVERYERSRSIVGILRNRSIYDLQLSSIVGTQSENTPPQSTLQEADLIVEDTNVANLTLTQLVPFGGTVQLDYRNSRFETTDLRLDPNPRFRIDLDFTVTQPLLRDFGRDVNERNLMVARTDVAISREDFQTRVEEILQQVIDGYWDLVEAREQLAVAEESLKLAEDLDRMNRIQVKVGTLAALEVVQSEAGVAARKESLITLSTQVDDAADVLRSLVNLEATDAWDAEIIPVTDPNTATRPEVDLEQAIETAYRNRPDMRRRRLQNETLELDTRIARHQKLPRLDLSATYGFNALDGDRFVFDAAGEVVVDDMGVPIRTPGGYSDALDQIAGADFDGWSLSVEVGYPIQNRDARALAVEADLAAEQGDLQLRQLELQVRADVRSAARALRAAAQRVEIAKISSQLALKSLEAEQKGYENGLSTSFEVLRIQEDLSEARSREVSAIVGYRRAEVAYHRAIGKLLDRCGVVLAGDDRSRW